MKTFVLINLIKVLIYSSLINAVLYEIVLYKFIILSNHSMKLYLKNIFNGLKYLNFYHNLDL